MTIIEVTVTAGQIVNGEVQCTYNPPGPYTITKNTHNVLFTLDSASIANGWQYTGNISNNGGGQLSISGSGNSVTVADLDTTSGTFNYQLGMSSYGGDQVWGDPQNVNTGEG